MTIAKSAKWERKTGQGREDGRPAGVQRRRAVQADPGDVLRRHRHPGRQRRRRRSRSCSPAASRPRRAPARRSRRRRWWCCTGARSRSFPAFVTSVSAKYTLFTRRRHADPGGVQRVAGGDAGRAGQAEPDLRAATTSAGCTAPSPVTRWPRSPTPSTATRRCGGRWPRSTASTTRCACRTAPPLLLPAPEELAGRDEHPTSTAFLVEIDGNAAARRRRAAARSRPTSTTACGCRHVRRCASATRAGSCWPSPASRSARRSKISVPADGSQTPEPLIEGEVTALEAEFDSGGTFTVIRGYDQAHRLFRGRRTESYTQMTASDVATKVAQRAGLTVGDGRRRPRTVFDHVSQGGQTDWEFLDAAGPRDRLRGRRAGRQVRLRAPPTRPPTPRAASSGRARNPLVLRAGQGPAAVPVGGHLGRSRSTRSRSAAGTSPEAGAGRDRAGADHAAPSCRRSNPAGPGQDVRRPGLRRHRRPLPHPGRGRRGGRRAGRGDRRRVRRVRGRGPGQPEAAGRRGDHASTGSASRSTASTPSPRPGTGSTRPPATPPSFSVTGRQERSLLGLASGGARGRAGAGRRGDRPGQRRQRPGEGGRVKLTFPWLSDDYVSDWARTVQPGAGKDRGWAGAARGRRRGAGGLRAGRLRRPVRARRALQRRRHDADRAGRPDRRRLGCGQPAVAGVPARPPDRPARRGRPDRGRHAGHHRTTSCCSSWTTSAPRSPCTATARS